MSAHDDWPHSPIPPSGQKSFWSVAAVWIGFVFVPVVIQITFSLASTLSFRDFLTAILVGSLILGLCSGVAGYIAQKKSMSFSLLARSVFGEKGYLFAALLPPICLIGWDSFNISLVSRMTTEMTGWENFFPFFCIFYAIWFMTSAVAGFEADIWISRIAVPLMAVIIMIGGAKALAHLPLANFKLDSSWPALTSGVVAVVGSFALGASVCSPDIQRFCKTPKHAAGVGLVTFGIAFPFILILGGLFAIHTGSPNVVHSFSKIGLLPLGFALLVLLSWTTCDNDYYSAALGLSHIFRARKSRMVILSATIACIIAILGIENYLTRWLILMSSIATPTVGVIFADYLAEKYLYAAMNRHSNWRISPLLAWALGAVTAYLSAKWEIGIPPLQGIVAAMLIHLFLFPLDKALEVRV